VSEQLPLSTEAPPEGPVRYRLYQHVLTKRLYAIEWCAGDATGIAGPVTGEPSDAELATLDYNRNPAVLRHVARDFLDQAYTHWIRSEDLA
jgi:hypothetical protein